MKLKLQIVPEEMEMKSNATKMADRSVFRRPTESKSWKNAAIAVHQWLSHYSLIIKVFASFSVISEALSENTTGQSFWIQ